ncbi:protein dachsous [Eupeodes corollae]|uniref:protein dachsous n=1 Tax=Eupeodes corollae TaxID=290404 RepID=UPI00249094BB|nr:protein dachsous [Eupeodes corollae]
MSKDYRSHMQMGFVRMAQYLFCKKSKTKSTINKKQIQIKTIKTHTNINNNKKNLRLTTHHYHQHYHHYHQNKNYDLSIQKSIRRNPMVLWILVICIVFSATGGAASEYVRNLEVSEGVPIGRQIGFIGDVNGRIDSGPPYLIVPVPGSAVETDLSIDHTTGEIRTKIQLDRERRASYSLVAIPLSGDNVRVVIKVLDENDNAPTFPTPVMNIEFPENTPKEVKRTLNPARDLDLEPFNTQSYSIVSGNTNGAFRLAPHREMDGVYYLDLQIFGFLDRETTPSYSLVIEAADGGSPPLKGQMTVNITIQDVNDNQPIFNQSQYFAQIAENVTVGTSVLQVYASDTDADENGLVEYSINRRQSDKEQMFRIDSHTGMISVNKPLDFEAKELHELVVVAKDHGEQPLETTAFVSITVTDVNDNQPTINVIFLSDDATPKISESAQPGEFVARISVNDPDSKTEYSNVNVTLQGGDDHFGLTTRDNIIYLVIVELPLDREMQPNYTLSVVATDNGNPPLHASKTIYLRVTDINDNAPEFEKDVYYANVMEVADPGTSVIQVVAVDKDEGNNSAVIYSLVDTPETHSQWFQVNAHTGLITTRAHIDCETEPVPQLKIVAKDNGHPPLSSTATVLVTIHDVNDNEPIFDQSFYNVSVPEKEPLGRCILKVSASDPDCGVNAMVNYTLGEGIKQLAEFEVRPASGEICISSDLDYEKRSSYEFPVIATDRGGLSTSAMVKIQLIDVNDNRPEFYPKEYNVSLRDTSTGSMSDETPVVSVVATDPDSGRNGEVTYRIVAGNKDGIFRIDKMSGEVFVDRPNLLSMSMRSHPFHILNISATDGGGIKTSQDAVIYISIIDSTQRPPIFEKSRYNYFVKEDVARGTIVGSVMATSSDSGSRNVVTYSIYTGDPDDYFTIDKNSGDIRVAKPLDHEAKPQILLNIQAKSGDPPAYGHTQVNIDIEDVNDNPPEFETSMVRISVPENVELGAPLYAAHARDKDSGKSGIVTYSLTMIGSMPSHLNVTTAAAAAAAMYGGSSMFMSPGPASGSSSSSSVASSLTSSSSSSSSLLSSLNGGGVGSGGAGAMGRLYSIRNGNHNQIGSGSQQQLYGMGAGGGSGSSYLLAANSLPLDLQQQQHHLVRPSAMNQAQLFAIDSRSGHLTLSRHLDYETSQRHSLIVTATDSGEPPLSANLTILVEVQDVNDNPPVFERNEYSIKVLESMPINSQILQVTAIDLDTGNNARLTYRLTDSNGNSSGDKKFLQPSKANLTIPLGSSSGANASSGLRSLAMMAAIKGVTNAPITASSDPNQLFGIFPNSGWIYLRGTLDRETRDRYELTVMASDNGTPSAHAKTRVTVNILDANDNDPRFVRNTYEFAIEENMRRGAIVGTVSATDLDLDANAAIRYSLIPSNTSFQVNPVTGEIITREPLDRETRSLYDLVAEARDQGTPYRSARVAVKVMVTDVNDNSPDIVDPQEDVVSVREEQPPGTEVVRIRAVDRDNGQNASITYTILKSRDSDGYGLFSIDPSSGQIRTRVVLDHEERSIYRLAVAATDGGVPPKQTVRLLRVEVLDLNDNRPTFTSSSLVFRVREDVPVGHVVGSVGPSERSDTQNMIAEPGLHITYTLTSLTKDTIEGAFDMDRQTGFLVVARRLDREQQSEYRLEIRALDNTASNNPQSSAITVKVEIADVNDNPPKWAEDPIMIYVSESTAIGVIIYNFTATDADTGTNGELQYKLLRQSPDGVDVATTSHQLQLQQQQDQQQLQQQNQNHQEQQQQKQSLFSVDPLTGALTLQAALDYETISEYILIVQALDQSSNATERLHSTVTARILVEDANDNGPVFVSPAGGSDTIIELSDATQVGQLVAHVVATDKDSGDNGHITYAILSGNEDGRFRIDSKTGFIELAKPLPQMIGNSGSNSNDDANGIYGTNNRFNRDHRSRSRSSSNSNGGHKGNNKFNLVISASDHGSPHSKQSHLNLQILVHGTTSNPPRFLQSVYRFNISENLPSGTPVFSVGAKSFNGANLTYKIPLGVANNHFIVDTYRGTVKSQGQFDRETKDEYTIPIYVFETNRAPSVAIQRSQATTLTSATSTAGAGAGIGISDTAQSTHVTSVAESQPPQHGEQFDIATIVIKITDVNDHAPEFHPDSCYRMSVPENSDLAVIHTVVATDLDEGANGEIVYSIIGGNLGNKFSIDMHTGELTARSLDREQHSRYSLQIQAQDRGTPITYQGLCNITVSVLDQNDNDPRFEQTKYIANIPEDIAIGSSVLKVTANDADWDRNARILYSLANETEWLFAIDNQTGLITVVGPLDRERQHIYNFEVVATDDGPYDSRSQRVPVQIIVDDVNDNKPIFDRYPFRTQVPTLNQPGKALLDVRATDADQGINGEIFYSLIQDATAKKFRINPSTGTVSATQSLASENGKLLHLKVRAQDKSNQPQSSIGLIEIRVGEPQSGSPLLRFQNDTYHVRLRENTAIGQSVIRVSAVRSDGRRQKIIYSFGAGNEDDAFSIDAITGEIKVRNSEHLDYEKYSWPSSSLSGHAQSSSMASSNGRSLFHGDDGNSNDDDDIATAANRSNSLNVAANRTTQTVRRMRRGITYGSSSGNSNDMAATSTALADHSSPVPSEMRLILVAHTEETPLLYGYAELHIILEDENDNGPHFTQQQYSATVWEGNSKGTLVVQVQALDADAGSNSRVLYHIVDGNHDNAFVIEPAFSGIVKTNIVLDREIRDIYKLKVIATDEGVPQMTGTATIQVHIIDVNDNQPTFPPHSVISVSEGTEPGSVITIISANDVDTYPELTYRFASEDDTTSNSNSHSRSHTSLTSSATTRTTSTSIYEENTSIFAIDRYSGKVILRKRLDYELQQEYQLEIIASDTAHEARTTLTVRVTDENDNAPVFQQLAYYTMLPDQMSSNGDRDIELLTVNATDIDSERNALIRYSIHPPQAGFSIHESSGSVYVNTSRINAAVGRDDIYLTILATDSGTPPQQSSTIVMVQANANSQGRAQFLQTQYRTSINEEAPLGTVVLRLSQDVLDTELTQHLVFTIVAGNEDGTFEVYQSSAIILVQPLDRERVDLYKLRLIMSEKGAPLRADNNSSAINVFVTVEDANDNSPVFDSSGQYEAEISESAPLRYSIAQLLAVDADLENTPNSDIVYDITSGNDEGMFTVDLVSGVLFVNNQLDYDRGAMNYELIVRACDSAAVPRCNLQPFAVSLVDENDNAPRFPVAEYIEFIGENEAVGTSIFTARATDLDRGIYGSLNYSIDQSDPHNMAGDELVYKLFRVDATSGVVTSNAIFDYEQRNRYDFVLRATDTGGKYATVKVRIMIDSKDEYSPQFTERTYRFVMSSPAEENMQLGYTVGQVSASDRDKGADGRVVYQLTSQHAYFKVNRTTGAVVIKKKLDDNFDDGRDISLVITASSGRQGSLTNMTVVEISLDPLGHLNTNMASNVGAPSSGGGFADWALGLLIAFLLVICAFAGIFLFLHMRNRRHRQVSKPSLSTETVGNTNSYVDPSAFDTIPIRGGSGATGSAGQFAPPKYDEIPPYGPHAASSNSGAATTSELSGSEQSGSSGRGSAEDDGEDEEIRMINEGPLHRDHHRGSDDGRLSDISVQNTQEYLARLGIVDNPNTTGAASTSSRRCSESIGGSNKDSHLHHPLPIDSLHMFDEEPGGESDITNLIYAKLNDVNGGSDRASSTDEAATTAGSIGAAVDHVMGFGDVPVVGSGNVGPSMNGSLSSIVHSEEELTGSYNWDYLLDWGPQYQPLAHVFSEIARLKDDTLSVHSGNSGASSSAKSKQSLAHSAKHIPPPLLTNVAPRSINVPVLSSRGSGSHHSSVPANQYLLPRSPISHDAPGGGFSTSSAMSPSFSPSLSPLATRSPSISPHVVGGVPTGHHMVSLPRHQPQPQQRKNLDNEMRVRM